MSSLRATLIVVLCCAIAAHVRATTTAQKFTLAGTTNAPKTTTEKLGTTTASTTATAVDPCAAEPCAVDRSVCTKSVNGESHVCTCRPGLSGPAELVKIDGAACGKRIVFT